jgi:hypothetical protein
MVALQIRLLPRTLASDQFAESFRLRPRIFSFSEAPCLRWGQAWRIYLPDLHNAEARIFANEPGWHKVD